MRSTAPQRATSAGLPAIWHAPSPAWRRRCATWTRFGGTTPTPTAAQTAPGVRACPLCLSPARGSRGWAATKLICCVMLPRVVANGWLCLPPQPAHAVVQSPRRQPPGSSVWGARSPRTTCGSASPSSAAGSTRGPSAWSLRLATASFGRPSPTAAPRCATASLPSSGGDAAPPTAWCGLWLASGQHRPLPGAAEQPSAWMRRLECCWGAVKRASSSAWARRCAPHSAVAPGSSCGQTESSSFTACCCTILQPLACPMTLMARHGHT